MNLKALPSGQTALRRADFLNALVDLIPSDIVHFGKRVNTVVEHDDRVVLGFEDGDVVDADVVVGCDGIRSRVKECMMPVESLRTKPVYSGMYGYRAVLEMGDMVKAVGEKRAHVLAELLGDSRVSSVDDVVAAFKAYDEVRRPRSQRVVTSSKENADIFCLCCDGVRDDPVKLRETLDQRLKWLWDLDVQDQVERAREKMVEYLEIG